MKFRTDFVTNSSSSSFLTFNIQNEKLFEFLKSLGITIKGVENGKLSHRMKITLPSGASTDLSGCYDLYSCDYPDESAFNSISAWVVGMLLYEIESCKKAEEYSEFTKELIDILNNANITNLDWTMVKSWSRNNLVKQLSKIDDYDAEMESADIEYTDQIEGQTPMHEKISVTGGKKTKEFFYYSYGYEEEEEYDEEDEYHGREPEDCEDIKFVVIGKMEYFSKREHLVHYIEDLGGCVTGSVTSSVDYLICNDSDLKTSETTKARELGVEIISELDFLKKFGVDIERFEIEEDEEEITGKDSSNGLANGSLGKIIRKKYITSTEMEIWEDGQWVVKQHENYRRVIKNWRDVKFVISGKMKYFHSREDLVDYIKELEACVTGSVTSSVDYLICNNPDSISSKTKTKKARELGVKIISESDFLKMFGSGFDSFYMKRYI